VSAVAAPDALDLEHTVAQFAIGDLVGCRPASDGANSHSYHLRTKHNDRESDFVLTFVDPPALPASSFVTLLDRCAEVGLPVAALIRTDKNLPYASANGTPAYLTRALPGHTVYNPTRAQLAALGRFAARLHVASASVEYLLPDFPKNVSWLHDQGQRLQGHVGFDCIDLISEATARVTSLLRRTDVVQLPTGVIHSALTRNNVLFDQRGLTGVLRLDSATQGTLIFDLGVLVNDWCSAADGVLDSERVVALLKGYQEVRAFTRQELWFIPSFALYAALAEWVCRLSPADDPHSTNGQRFCNPSELQRLVQQHLAHTFYLDGQLLC
jgi:homoserine kinase type II